MRVAKTKALISCVVTAQLIYSFFFAYTKNRFFSHATSLVNNSLRYSLDFVSNHEKHTKHGYLRGSHESFHK